MEAEQMFNPVQGAPMASKRSRYGVPAAGVPIVSDIERAAELLKLEPERLRQAVAAAGLAPWGRAASGATVYRFPELADLAEQHGGQAPQFSDPHRLYAAAARGRANRHHKSDP